MCERRASTKEGGRGKRESNTHQAEDHWDQWDEEDEPLSLLAVAVGEHREKATAKKGM